MALADEGKRNALRLLCGQIAIFAAVLLVAIFVLRSLAADITFGFVVVAAYLLASPVTWLLVLKIYNR